MIYKHSKLILASSQDPLTSLNQSVKNEEINSHDDIKSEYYLGEQFETYSRQDGYSQTPSRSATGKTVSIKDEIYEDNLGDSTICSSQASTIYSDDISTLHDGMHYDLLLQDDESDNESTSTLVSDEPLVQEGKLLKFKLS